MLCPALVECEPGGPTAADFLPDIIVRTMENTFSEVRGRVRVVVGHIGFMCKYQEPFQWLKNWAENPNTSPATQGIKLSEKKLSDNTATSGRSCGVGWVGGWSGWVRRKERGRHQKCELAVITHIVPVLSCLVRSGDVLSFFVLSCLVLSGLV